MPAIDFDFDFPPAPRRSDILFRSDQQLRSADVCMNPGAEFPYREGYRRGAHQLVEYVCTEGRQQDFFVYPIVYLYRHHVELALKSLLPLAANLAEEELNEKCMRDLERHRIDELWNDLKYYLKKERITRYGGFAFDPDDLAGINSYIGQLSNVDPDAQAFRFPRRKDGSVSIPDTLIQINLAVFGNHMESLCNYLDGLEAQLDNIRDFRDEMEAEYRSEMYSEYGAW